MKKSASIFIIFIAIIGCRKDKAIIDLNCYDKQMNVTPCEQIVLKNYIKCYPLPFIDFFTIRFSFNQKTVIETTLFDKYGTEILTRNYIINKGIVEKNISVPSLKSGVYILEIKGLNQNYYHKILKI